MVTLFLLLMVVLLAFYVGWLHRRVRKLEAAAGVPTPVFAGVEEKRVKQLIGDALRQYTRGGS